ncbi:MAG: YoaH family protein [Symbiopectobacterium sp.]
MFNDMPPLTHAQQQDAIGYAIALVAADLRRQYGGDTVTDDESDAEE